MKRAGMLIAHQLLNWIRAHPIWSGLIALVVISLGWLLLAPEKPEYEYIAAKATRGEVIRKVTASGKLRALNTIKVGAEVSGQITDVYVDFNTPVRAGQLLAEIDPTRFRARVEQAQAQTTLVRANLLQAEAAATRARVDLTTQQRDYDRKKALAARDFLSEAGLDNSANLLAAARAALASAHAQVAAAKAQIAQSEAELQTAQLDLRRTRIVAPTSGVIINKLVEPGTTVAASFQTPNLFEIASDTTRMQVEASVDEADIGQVREGQDVRFTVDSYPDERFAAKVRQIRKAASETQNVVSYLVILDVDNRDGKLLPGMTANVEIVTAKMANVLRVPAAALRFRPRPDDRPEGLKIGPKSTMVFVPSDDPFKPRAQPVTLGLMGEEFVEITKGLTVGTAVLTRSRATDEDSGGSDAVNPETGEEEEGGGGHPTP
jgi:HlyD family secretion protein